MLACVETPPAPPSEGAPLSVLLEARSLTIVHLRYLDALIWDARQQEERDGNS